MLKKWGSSVYLRPAWRRGYVEVLKLLDYIESEEEEGEEQIPKEVLDFLVEHQDPDYHFEVEFSGDPDLRLDEMLDALSWEGWKVLDMIIRYFWDSPKEREERDQRLINSRREEMIRRQEYVQEGIEEFLRRRQESGEPFRGMELKLLRNHSLGCTQALAVLDRIIPQYRKRIPKEYIWLLETSAKKQYQYDFVTERDDGSFGVEKVPAEETWEILADISERYWKGYHVAPEEIEIQLNYIPWEG